MLVNLADYYFTAIVVPVALLLCGALAKKLARGRPGWKYRDFYFGVEFTLAALSSELTRVFNIANNLTNNSQIPLISTATFIVVTLLMLF